MKVILIHNPFEFSKPKTWLAWMIRKATDSNWNHCAVLIDIEGEETVCDFQARAKVRTYEEWLLDDKKRSYLIVEKKSIMPESWIRSQVINSSGRFLGYDFLKIINHATYIKKKLVVFKENPDRFVCSEFVEYLLTGNKVNWAIPKDFEEKLNIKK